MDTKDLELLTVLYSNGRADEAYLSSEMGLTGTNINRRIRLLVRKGIIKGFSAFFDRRMFGFDTTYVKLHYKMKDMDRVIDGVSRLPEVTMVYPNMDDFMIVEIVHWDRDVLHSVIRAMERISRPMTVSAHYIPRMPEEVPETPSGKDLEILMYLVNNGRLSDEMISSKVGLGEDKVNSRISDMIMSGTFKVRPMIQEELIEPYPTFTTLLTLAPGYSLSECFSGIMNTGKGVWDCMTMERPPAIWIKSFGKDIHAMNLMMERFRREDYIDDVMLLIPESVVINRSPDLAIIKKAMDK